jgi:hypothetical protein
MKYLGLTVALGAMLTTLDCTARAETRELITRPDVNGRPTQIPRARNFAECVADGMKLGYPRIGPGGESDRRGAVGFCRTRFPQ